MDLHVFKSLNISKQSTDIAVIGSGSWATALVKIFTDARNHVHWYVRDPEEARAIRLKNRNPSYLSEIKFRPRRISVSSDINEVVKASNWIVLAIPSAFLDATLRQITIPIKDKNVVSGVKGIIPESKCIVGDHLHQNFDLPWDQFIVIAGPSHAEEVALERLSYLTLASTKKSNAVLLKKLMQTNYIHVKTSKDVVGVEYAATLKNIFALAVGIAHGLNYGDNFQSVLMSNAIREMNRFLKKLSKSRRNINQSAYLGDLLVTGYSTFSRNRRFGNMIGRGYTVKGAQLEMNMIAEGYYAAQPIYKRSQQLQINTPIIDSVYQILYGQQSPKKSFKSLAKKLN